MRMSGTGLCRRSRRLARAGEIQADPRICARNSPATINWFRTNYLMIKE